MNTDLHFVKDVTGLGLYLLVLGIQTCRMDLPSCKSHPFILIILYWVGQKVHLGFLEQLHRKTSNEPLGQPSIYSVSITCMALF